MRTRSTSRARSITHMGRASSIAISPANIMITPAGPAPRFRSGEGGDATRWVGNIEHSGRTETLTEQGTILGTLNYMSPEQLEGNRSTSRAGHLWDWRHPLRDDDRTAGLFRVESSGGHRGGPARNPPALSSTSARRLARWSALS